MQTGNETFSISRTFNAPRQLVFDAFTTAEALEKWWGPVEAPITVMSLDFRPDGIFHYRMNGRQVHYGVFRYVAIDAPNSVTWINSFADEHGNIIKPPFPGIDIPKEILNKITFVEHEGITTVTLFSEPVHATEEEIKTFYAITDSMNKGFNGTLDQLEKYLEEIRK